MNQYRFLLYSVVLTILGFGLWIGFKDHEKIMLSIHQIGWRGFLFVCFLSLINYSLRYFRWRILLVMLNDRVPFFDGLLCYLTGFALTTTPGKAGETVRSLYFKKRHGVNHTHSLAAILSERASDALAGFLLATLALYSFEQYRWIGVTLLVLIVAVIGFINQGKLLLRISSYFRFIRINAVQKLLDALPEFVTRSSTLLSLKALGLGTAIAMVSWSAEGFGFGWLALRLGGTEPQAVYVSIFAIGMIAGAISFLPGGIGSAEVMLYLLLRGTGMGDVESLTITLLCRLATLWFAVILGLLAMMWLGHRPYNSSSRINNYP